MCFQNPQVVAAHLASCVLQVFDVVSLGYRPALVITCADAADSNLMDVAQSQSSHAQNMFSVKTRGHIVPFGKTLSQSLHFCRFMKAVHVVFSLLKQCKVSTKRGHSKFSIDYHTREFKAFYRPFLHGR